MYAIVRVAGMQYLVREGQTVAVPRLPAEPGSTLRFDDVLFVRTEKDLKLGRPRVPDAFVEADVVAHFRSDKVTTFKFIRRESYRRRKGHHQQMTRIKVTKITFPS